MSLHHTYVLNILHSLNLCVNVFTLPALSYYKAARHQSLVGEFTVSQQNFCQLFSGHHVTKKSEMTEIVMTTYLAVTSHTSLKDK